MPVYFKLLIAQQEELITMMTNYYIFFKHTIFILGCISLFLLPGCASLNKERQEIIFAKTSYLLKYKKLDPNSNEKDGLKLRLYQQNRVLKYNDHLQIFTQIADQEGIEVKVDKTRKVIFSPGTSIDNFLMTTETKSKDLSETSNEQLLMSNRGEILKFIRGEHISGKGRIKILSWSRTPIFPKKTVKIGDSWSYIETIKIKLESFWITRKIEGPDKIKVYCTLKGFAEMKGHRCAIIETRIVNSKNESYTALFKTMKLNINTHITEKIFFDYKRGLEIGRRSNINSFTTSDNMTFSDVSKSQSISVLNER
jgi:hypothetical protein